MNYRDYLIKFMDGSTLKVGNCRFLSDDKSYVFMDEHGVALYTIPVRNVKYVQAE